jgi:hypothetical protein
MRKSLLFFSAVACALGVLGCLTVAAAMNLGLVPRSAAALAGVILLLGILIVAGLHLLLASLGARQSTVIEPDLELTTMTFPPNRQLGSRRLVRVK